MRKPIKKVNDDPETFGSFIRAKRMARGMSLRDLADALGISPAYMSEIERNRRCAPSIYTGLMDALIDKLHLIPDDLDAFYDLAGASRDFMYEELCAYLKNHPAARRTIRVLARQGTDDSFWEQVSNLRKTE